MKSTANDLYDDEKSSVYLTQQVADQVPGYM